MAAPRQFNIDEFLMGLQGLLKPTTTPSFRTKQLYRRKAAQNPGQTPNLTPSNNALVSAPQNSLLIAGKPLPTYAPMQQPQPKQPVNSLAGGIFDVLRQQYPQQQRQPTQTGGSRIFDMVRRYR